MLACIMHTEEMLEADKSALADEQKRVRDMERSLYRQNEYYPSKTEFKDCERDPK
jgi:hypothetical protein